MGMKVVIAGGGTGGHLMPALAIARALVDARPDIEPVLVGAQRGIEAQVLPRYPYRFHLLPLEPIYRRAWWRNLRWPLIAWRALWTSGRILGLERPVLVIGTGGYASGPVIWIAQHHGIPTALQESDAFPGIATRWLARRARQVHLGFPEAQARLRVGSGTEVFVHGNPIVPPVSGDPNAAVRKFGLDPARRTVLIFGGSQGSRAINEATADALRSRRLDGVNLLWGTGSAQLAQYAAFARAGQTVVQGFFDPMAAAYQAADLVVCRSGAMTIAELCAWGKASVLVPLPTAAADHQMHNARALAADKAGVLLAEPQLSGTALAEVVADLLADPERLERLGVAARRRGRPHASQAIVSSILTLIPEGSALSQV
jgi:UDP-N-acetylglucosamine--N-acetylmuramyl-(pentapeptide) pyrophosphoryl-undecaprenol N-acetylglucosamine transferase